MNSFSAIVRAVDYEFERQVELIKEGKEDTILLETRTWDEVAASTHKHDQSPVYK